MSLRETFSGTGEAAVTAVGRREERPGCLTPDLAGMLGAALSHDLAPAHDTRSGAPMPRLWHWAAFPEFVPMAALGSDGHPELGGFLPGLPYPRRMWAGGQLVFSGVLRIGEDLFRRSEIRSVAPKDGATGPMVFVRVNHVVEGASGGRIEEEQDIVYLDIPDRFRPPKRVAVPDGLSFDEPVPVTEARLFRFSAATFNAHRIHYDLAFAREVEKYPALVVHAPMQACLLMEAAERHTRRTAHKFSFRGVHPMFHDHGLRLTGRPDPNADAIDLGTAAPEGYYGLRARMEWAA